MAWEARAFVIQRHQATKHRGKLYIIAVLENTAFFFLSWTWNLLFW